MSGVEKRRLLRAESLVRRAAVVLKRTLDARDGERTSMLLLMSELEGIAEIAAAFRQELVSA